MIKIKKRHKNISRQISLPAQRLQQAEQLYSMGLDFQKRVHINEALHCYLKSIELNPNHAVPYINVGLILQEKGRINEAITYYESALRLNPNDAITNYNLGSAFQKIGQLEKAITFYDKALQINPRNALTYNNLGTAFYEKGRLDKAISCYKKAIELDSTYVNAYSNLGISLHKQGQLDEAITCYQKALLINPNHADTYINVGISYRDKGQLDEAIAYYQRALQINPTHKSAFINLGVAAYEKGKLSEAINYYRKAIEISPDFADAHWNLSNALLLSGEFEEGWKEYEWRWNTKHAELRKSFPRSPWNGSNIAGLTILLYADQGFGDAIHFIRYAPLVSHCGAKIIIECQNGLASLLQNIEGISGTYQVFARGEQLPDFATHCPLSSLPSVFKTNLKTIPVNVPYLKVNHMSLQKWKSKVQNDNSKLRIGLVWSGNPKFGRDRFRSCELNIFSPLARFNYITFYSLQKGAASKQAKSPPKDMKLVDYTDEIDNFSDTAAFIESLDLVISVDTAVSHLAGAIGKRVWTLLPFVPDWRWLSNREDSPWYPTMRLFRQPSSGDWESVITKVKNELLKLLSKN